jgi:LPXTG-motif cell wall-anchored protein
MDVQPGITLAWFGLLAIVVVGAVWLARRNRG